MTDNAERIRHSRSGSRMMHGGYSNATPFTADERSQLEALIDTLVPPEEEWPGATDLRIADLLEAYIVPEEEPMTLYPHWRRNEFSALLGLIGGPLVGAGLDERVALLQTLESTDPALFARIRDFVYYVYYGHPAVVELIRSKTTYGADYLGGGQPEGYISSLETWGNREFTSRGAFIPTESVLRTLTAGTVASRERA